MDSAKVRLSEEEKILIARADWILTKNDAIQKITQLLSGLQVRQSVLLGASKRLPPEAFSTSPKISKGENYLGLPYVILDYPRYFDKENILAIRSFFWWGHFFSTTLQLAGTFKKNRETQLTASYDWLAAAGFSICVHAEQWKHHFEADNYVSVDALTLREYEQTIMNRPFVKLAKKIPLGDWDNLEKRMEEDYRLLLSLLDDQLPRR